MRHVWVPLGVRCRRSRLRLVVLSLLVIVVVAAAVWWRGLVANREPAPTAGVPLAGWNVPLAADAALETDPRRNGTENGGTPYAQRFAHQAEYTKSSSPVAGFYDRGYATIIDAAGAPVYRVPRDQTTQRVVWIDAATRAPAAPGLASNLQGTLEAVPLPTGPDGQRFERHYGRAMDAGAGEDHQLVVYQPSTHRMWEFFDFRWNAAEKRYECGYAGYTPDTRKGAMALPHGWGARATSLPLVGGIMLQTEYAAGVFDHPLEVALPVIEDGWLSPATRQDGTLAAAVPGGDRRDAVPEGAWFRLPADYRVDPHKPKLWRMMVTAARDYGIIVVDQTGGTMTFSAESANAVGTPYSPLSRPSLPGGGVDSLYAGPNNVLNTFPWDDLVQVAHGG